MHHEQAIRETIGSFVKDFRYLEWGYSIEGVIFNPFVIGLELKLDHKQITNFSAFDWDGKFVEIL